MTKTKIRIGTRGSALALRQTEIVRELLAQQNAFEIEVKIIKTEGDSNLGPIPLDTVGKGWFTKEIERELLSGAIDLAVHSLKDLPEELPEELHIGAVVEREDARDVLVSKDGSTLEQLKRGAIIGTDSLRRAAQILHLRPDLHVESIRGNVLTRIEKLKTGNYDALILAAAGLNRLGLGHAITQYFDISLIVPAPGQGALAVEKRKDDAVLQPVLDAISHQTTQNAVNAERAFSAAIGGGCKMPVGAYGVCKDGTLKLWGMVGTPNGSNIMKEAIEGTCENARELGYELATRMLRTCGKEILRYLQQKE